MHAAEVEKLVEISVVKNRHKIFNLATRDAAVSSDSPPQNRPAETFDYVFASARCSRIDDCDVASCHGQLVWSKQRRRGWSGLAVALWCRRQSLNLFPAY